MQPQMVLTENSDFVSSKTATPRGIPYLYEQTINAAVIFVLFAVLSWVLVDKLTIWQTAQALTQRGVVAQASVIGIEQSGGRRNTTYTAIFRYEVAGSRYENRQELREVNYDRLTEGQTIDIRYLPDAPQRAMLLNTDVEYTLYQVLFVSVFVLLALWRVLRNIWKSINKWRLRQNGRLVLARVVSYGPSKWAKSSSERRDLRYEFTSPQTSSSLSGMTEVSDKKFAGRTAPQAGDVIALAYIDDKLHSVV